MRSLQKKNGYVERIRLAWMKRGEKEKEEESVAC